MPEPAAVSRPTASAVAAVHASSWWLLALPGSAVFVLAAVVLEVTGGANANSPIPTWAHVVPIGWPQWVRVTWWLGVAVAAVTFRVGLRRCGLPTRRLGDAVAVVPFVAFAAGIALGADWATWH